MADTTHTGNFSLNFPFVLTSFLQEIKKPNAKVPAITKPKLEEDPQKLTAKLLDDLVKIDTPFNKLVTVESLTQVNNSIKN